MRCPECAERNSVAARKCEFCGTQFKKKPLPLGLKLTIGGIALAVTGSIALSQVLPQFVDPEQKLDRAARQLAAGPKNLEHAAQIKKDFSAAFKEYLKQNGGEKTSDLTAALQKLLPSAAFEAHVIELPRGLRVVEVDTLLQATSYLVMKTSSGTKVFDLPGFEVFDDAQILDDAAGPVLALLGHTGGQLPHKPILRTYALLPDFIHDETDKLVPPLKINGTAKFAKNGQDVVFEVHAARGVSYGTLTWKDAHYVQDTNLQAANVAAGKVVAENAVAAPVVATSALPAGTAAASKPEPSKTAAGTQKSVVATPDAAVAAVSSPPAAIKNLKETAKAVERELGVSTKKQRETGRRKAEVARAGATLRARPERGSAAMNAFGRGTRVTVLGTSGDWSHVRVNGQEGYIFSQLLQSAGRGASAEAESSAQNNSSNRRAQSASSGTKYTSGRSATVSDSRARQGNATQHTQARARRNNQRQGASVLSAVPAPASGKRHHSRRSDKTVLLAGTESQKSAAPDEPLLVP